MLFWGTPFLGGTALVDILPCRTGIKELRRECQQSFPCGYMPNLLGLLERLKQPRKAEVARFLYLRYLLILGVRYLTPKVVL